MPAETISIFEVDDYQEQIARGAAMLSAGGVMILPTETVYGAAGVLTHPEALARLRRLRPPGDGKPFTIHLARREDARQYLHEPGELGERMMKKLWPGPVGLSFDVPAERRKEVAAKLGVEESQLYDGSDIILRCPDHIVATDVIGRIDRPVVLTQASRKSGASPALRADQFEPAVVENVDLIFDAGPTRHSKPSTLLKVHKDRYEIVRSGVYDERIIQRLLRTTILFVCSGNTCRSPMAEALAKNILGKKFGISSEDIEKKGVIVTSVGSFALPGAKATPQAAEAIKALGGDLSRHRSRPLSVELLHQADVIYVMTRSHRNAVLALLPSVADNVKLLDPDRDIEDPIGGDQTLYNELAVQLQTLIEKRLNESGCF